MGKTKDTFLPPLFLVSPGLYHFHALLKWRGPNVTEKEEEGSACQEQCQGDRHPKSTPIDMYETATLDSTKRERQSKLNQAFAQLK